MRRDCSWRRWGASASTCGGRVGTGCTCGCYRTGRVRRTARQGGSGFTAILGRPMSTPRRTGGLRSVESASELRVVVEPGDLLCFSGAHLHASVPNATGVARFSVEARTVDAEDVGAGAGSAQRRRRSPARRPGLVSQGGTRYAAASGRATRSARLAMTSRLGRDKMSQEGELCTINRLWIP